MIGSIVGEILGLFIDDERLAIGVLAVVGLAAVLTLTPWAGQSVAGLVLVIGLPLVLDASVLLALKRATRK
jgi:hypothetical protein